MAAVQEIDHNTLPIRVCSIIDLILDKKDRFSTENVLSKSINALRRENYITLLAQAYLHRLEREYFTKSVPNDMYKNFIWKVLQKGFRIFKYDRRKPYSEQNRKDDLNSLSRFLTTFNEEGRAIDFNLNEKDQQCYDMMQKVVGINGKFGNTMVIFILQALEQAVDSKQIDDMKQTIVNTCIDVNQKGGKRSTRKQRKQRKQRKTRKN